MNAENLIALLIAIGVGCYLLYCLFRPEDL
jgi:K+-transporting ATPase KdpF subunit